MTSGKRPIIGLPGRRTTGRSIVGSPDVLLDMPVDLYFSNYAQGVFEAGGLPLHLPFDIDVEETIELLDGLLIPGGTDIDPQLYGAQAHPDLLEPESIRDRYELSLLDAAAETDLPVLGICRGVQILNVHGGGTLDQHVPIHSRLDSSPVETVHDVEFSEGSIVRGLYGESRSVNSFHHQTIADLSSEYLATGLGDDGVVETIESIRHRWLAVQWHPEMMATRADDPLFAWLVEEARR